MVVTFVESNPPQTYFSRSIGGLNASSSNHVMYLNGSIALFSNSSDSNETLVSIPSASSAQYMKLESDGQLKVYEWQGGWNEVDDLLTEKVDVYSFGIVVLEILSGRRHFEASESEDEQVMLNLFRKKAEEGQLVDLIDKRSEDMQFYKEEVIKTMQIAAWCLQSDYTKRPSMSMVVKAMEGVLDVDKDLDYSKPQTVNGFNFADSTPLLPSVLSCPR
ncbi:hypothetical protein K7X08_012118 [Anisodus acutangulus]|uniref:Protein kinase domain-containing protein n=1 Tax=Anisodus acutangulus TaxID=402998 RepID=A0A9Q1LDJ1_9SOLA|nr:hypothetical protein K7X08_012118 [Anisodus acutangulus]